MTINLGAVILAAGLSRRMGQQKLLLPLNDIPILANVLGTVMAFEWAECIAVIGEPQQNLAEICDEHQVNWIFNDARETGQASSIRLALSKLGEKLDGVIFIPGDQPLISEQLIKALIDRFYMVNNSEAIIVPQYKGQNFSPVIFGAEWRDSLMNLAGDNGGRSIIRENSKWVEPLEWTDKWVFYDADTHEEYECLIRENNRRH
ncbi:nucleotidyltransferase family protein [Dendrosporobacter sp. 1207_IL3150]|uniref:nucleotidyltransferase family protein n=1 Tax=Dendrosporobacter sp. 1207_IL3150 TaxID=3084054 RepID=UPI002FDB7914